MFKITTRCHSTPSPPNYWTTTPARQVSISLVHTQQRYLVLLSGTKCYNVCSPLCDRDSTEQTPAFHRWSTPLHSTGPSQVYPNQVREPSVSSSPSPLPLSNATKKGFVTFQAFSWMKTKLSMLENIKCCFEEKGTTKPWSSYLASTWKFKSPAMPDWLVVSLEATVRAVYVHAHLYTVRHFMLCFWNQKFSSEFILL